MKLKFELPKISNLNLGVFAGKKKPEAGAGGSRATETESCKRKASYLFMQTGGDVIAIWTPKHGLIRYDHRFEGPELREIGKAIVGRALIVSPMMEVGTVTGGAAEEYISPNILALDIDTAEGRKTIVFNIPDDDINTVAEALAYAGRTGTIQPYPVAYVSQYGWFIDVFVISYDEAWVLVTYADQENGLMAFAPVVDDVVNAISAGVQVACENPMMNKDSHIYVSVSIARDLEDISVQDVVTHVQNEFSRYPNSGAIEVRAFPAACYTPKPPSVKYKHPALSEVVNRRITLVLLLIACMAFGYIQFKNYKLIMAEKNKIVEARQVLQTLKVEEAKYEPVNKNMALMLAKALVQYRQPAWYVFFRSFPVDGYCLSFRQLNVSGNLENWRWQWTADYKVNLDRCTLADARVEADSLFKPVAEVIGLHSYVFRHDSRGFSLVASGTLSRKHSREMLYK